MDKRRTVGRRTAKPDTKRNESVLSGNAGIAHEEGWYQLLFNNVSDAVFVHFGPDETHMPGTFIEANEVACKRLGYTREELLRMKPSDIDAPETLANVPRMMKKLLKDKRASWEGLHMSKDGRRIPVEIHNSLVDHGGRKLILSTVRDITERKRVEEELLRSEVEAQRLAREKELIAEIGRIISSTVNIEEVYERFAEKVKEVIPFNRIAVTTINRDDHTRVIRYSSGDSFRRHRVGEAYQLVGSGMEEVFRTRSSLLVNAGNLEEMRRKLPSMRSLQEGSQATMIAPLIANNEVIGALYIRSADTDAYSEIDLKLAERIANQIAGAIANAQLFAERKQAEEELRRREAEAKRLARENELIAEIGRIIGSTLNIGEVYERFAEKVREVIPFDRIAVNTVNRNDCTRTIQYVKGDRFSGKRIGEIVSLAGTWAEKAVRGKSSLLVNSGNLEDTRKEFPGLLSLRFGAQSAMIIPLISKDEVIGILALHSVKSDAYSKNDLRLAERVGAQIAGAIDNARLFAERALAENELRKSAKEAKRLARENELIAEIGRIISSTLNLEEVYEKFAKKVREAIPFDRIGVSMVDLKRYTRSIRYFSGDALKDFLSRDDYPLAGTGTEEVVRTKSSLLINSKNREEVKRKLPGMMSLRSGVQSTMMLPVISNNEAIGALAIHSAGSDTYSEEDLNLAERVVSQISGAIANAQLFSERKRVEEELRKSEEEAKRLAQENELIAEVGRIISSTLNIEEVYGRFAEKVREVIPFHRIAVTTINREEYTRTIRYASGDVFQNYCTGEAYSLTGSGAEEVLRTKSSLLINAETREKMRKDLPGMKLLRGTQSTMVMPLISNNEVIGALYIHSADADAYSEKDLKLAERIANQIAGAIANAQLFAERKLVEEELRKSEEEAKRLARENELIAELGRIISSTLNIEEVYERFAGKVREVIPFDRIAISSANLKDHTRCIRYVSGDAFWGYRVGEDFPLAGTGSEEVVRTKSSLLVNRRNREEMKMKLPGMKSLQLGAQASMLIPFISHNEVMGVLALHSADGDAYSENDLQLAEKVVNQITGAIANAQLFAERNRLEQERISLEERLHRVEKMEALGTLAGGVAHDLNNVLGVLTGYSELLQEEIPKGGRLRTYVDNIRASSEKGAAIINDLLTLARRGVAVSEVVNLNGIVSAFFKTPVYERLQAYHHTIRFKTDLCPDLFNIKGSPLHLEKTVMNLISNAAEAITGEGEVTVRTENGYLDRTIRGYDQIAEGQYVVLTVSDTGRGIQAEDLDKIFEPFYTKKVMGRSGTGLGLAVVWGAVKDHNGYVDVQSEYGKGSTFTLYFPVTQEALDSGLPRTPFEQYRGNGETILVVDDVEQQREMATTMLTRLGYRVRTVSSGEEAAAYLKTHKADVMLLDMIMDPGIDGLETYRRVLEINPYQKAILVSGFSETDRVREAQKLGAGVYVKKPYTLEKISQAIRDELLKITPDKE